MAGHAKLLQCLQVMLPRERSIHLVVVANVVDNCLFFAELEQGVFVRMLKVVPLN